MATDIIDRLNDPEMCIDAIDDAIATIKGLRKAITLFDKGAMEDIEWAAAIVQDHVTKNKLAQEALSVRAHKESLFGLRDRLERLAFAIQGVLDDYR